MIHDDDDLPRPVRLSCRETAAWLGMSEKALARLRTERRGPPFFAPPGRRPFYLLSDLQDWEAQSRVRTYRA